MTGFLIYYILLLVIDYISHLRGELMTSGVSRGRNLSEEERKKIARELIEGYKKMAPLNRKLAEEYFIKVEGETK